MKHNYYVKHNGVLYTPGSEIPEGDTPKVVEETKEPAKTVEVSYTRTQIQQMNGGNLRKVATELGVDFSEDSTNKELKQMIMGKLGI